MSRNIHRSISATRRIEQYHEAVSAMFFEFREITPFLELKEAMMIKKLKREIKNDERKECFGNCYYK